MRRILLAIGLALTIWCQCQVGRGEVGAIPLGQTVADFTLPDFHGAPHALADFQGRPVVLAFVGVECPLAVKYIARLRTLADQFSAQGVAFLAVDANVQDSLTDLAAFARVHDLTFPLLKDNNNEIADRLGATRTPEVFLLDRQHVLRYAGRIDDQFGFSAASWYAKPVAAAQDLGDAIDAVLSGREIARPIVKPDGCLIGRVVRTSPHGEITYCRQIARILQDRCVECHRAGEVGPFALTSYDEVIGWSAMLREVVAERRMPPWFADPDFGHFANNARLTDEERNQICAWVDNGCPRGEDRDLPEPRTFATGWQMGTPDQVFAMSDRPHTVPADGVVAYEYFTVDTGWTEDRWIQATETRPGNRAVVHHIRVDVLVAKVGDTFTSVSGIGGFVPGNAPYVWPPGSAIHVPAGAKLRFQIHYTPNGVAQQDLSIIGIRFADPRTVAKLVNCVDVNQTQIFLPAGTADYQLTSSHVFQRDTLLMSLTPHMHSRGKSFRFELERLEGAREVLLDVPHYDFNWQLRYLFAEPKLVRKGETLHCTAHFDNSAENLANPDPTQDVVYGDQTWNEMMNGFYTAIDPDLDVACLALVALSLAQAEADEGRASAPPASVD